VSADPWEERLAATRAGVAPAAMLAGRWIGEGTAHGEPVRARLSVRLLLDGSVVEARERVGDHEDLCLYRYDVDTAQLRVLHVQPGALFEDHPVEGVPGGLVWVTGPLTPTVEWTTDGVTVACAVTFPGASEPDVRVRYRRAEGATDAG
jgi:hypothetical protein